MRWLHLTRTKAGADVTDPMVVPEGGPSRDVAVLTVDDQESFRAVLREMIDATAGFVLVGEACSGEEALAVVDVLSPELVLMDVRLSGMDGVTATRRIITRHPQTVVVLISAEDPELAPGVEDLSAAVACVRKQHLRPQLLRDVWAQAHPN
jgi:chemotaxis response regulator CheB